MSRVLDGSNNYYRKIAEQFGHRFRQNKMPDMKSGMNDRPGDPVFSVAFDGVFCDNWKGDMSGLIDKLAGGRSFFGVSGRRAGLQDVSSDQWVLGQDESDQLLKQFGKVVRKDGRSLNNCGEAKVLQKICSRKLKNNHVYNPKHFVICSFRAYSGSRLKIADPCENCQTWVHQVFGAVVHT